MTGKRYATFNTQFPVKDVTVEGMSYINFKTVGIVVGVMNDTASHNLIVNAEDKTDDTIVVKIRRVKRNG